MMKKLPILSRSSSASSLKTVGIDSLEEQTILLKVFPVEELHSTLKSDDVCVICLALHDSFHL